MKHVPTYIQCTIIKLCKLLLNEIVFKSKLLFKNIFISGEIYNAIISGT